MSAFDECRRCRATSDVLVTIGGAPMCPACAHVVADDLFTRIGQALDVLESIDRAATTKDRSGASWILRRIDEACATLRGDDAGGEGK